MKDADSAPFKKFFATFLCHIILPFSKYLIEVLKIFQINIVKLQIIHQNMQKFKKNKTAA